ncbi:helix-turn-helix domain-containing protein [Xanthobacter autotrophicus]|uniref:helix-turn-helix transcriptional regulator n=1 Tax=Xanthobacter TaxID=279 RepID=UPI0024AACE28|nr:helix-turn-helix domain-containing protein [Xanthobacter autotrophicus]MDI4663845.1 helix-turn-helix domain-containing protein [Xanthobacter autotrophicus]
MNVSTNTRLMSMRDAQDFLGLSKSTLYRMLGTGRLRGKKFGKRLMFEAHEIENFIASAPPARITTTS